MNILPLSPIKVIRNGPSDSTVRYRGKLCKKHILLIWDIGIIAKHGNHCTHHPLFFGGYDIIILEVIKCGLVKLGWRKRYP